MADARLINIDVEFPPSGMVMGTSPDERGLQVVGKDTLSMFRAAEMMLEAIAADAGQPVTALPVAGHPTQIVLVPRSPASAARLLLESPEAVERMARGLSDWSAIEDGDDPDQAWCQMAGEDRALLLNGFRSALRSIAGQEGPAG